MGISILSEVDDTSILKTGLPRRYACPLNWLPASHLLPPRSGLERSDFVLWHFCANARRIKDTRFQTGTGSAKHANPNGRWSK